MLQAKNQRSGWGWEADWNSCQMVSWVFSHFRETEVAFRGLEATVPSEHGLLAVPWSFFMSFLQLRFIPYSSLLPQSSFLGHFISAQAPSVFLSELTAQVTNHHPLSPSPIVMDALDICRGKKGDWDFDRRAPAPQGLDQISCSAFKTEVQDWKCISSAFS